MSNTGMSTPHPLEARVIELEIKTSFNEDLLEQLNQTVFRQQEQIDALIRELRELRRQNPEGGAGAPRSARDELPPHY
jgi:SlyX protein